MKINSVVFVSNYFNHHQKYLSDSFYELLGDGYVFIETIPMEAERISLGWKRYDEKYIVRAFDNVDEKKKAIKLINDADVVIIGSADDDYIASRMKSNKLIFRYSERPFKNGIELFKYPGRLIKYHLENPRKKPIYLLCSSAYTSSDYSKVFLFKNRVFKWGYFPLAVAYDIDKLIEKKSNTIVWCGRLIPCKHFEETLYAFKRLTDSGFDAQLCVIGDGYEKEKYVNKVKEFFLNPKVVFLGSVNSSEVRQHMENASVFLFNSDYREGWGAVVNEAMNSGCAIIASHAAGSVPYLIQDGVNGFIYKSKNINELYTKLALLFENKRLREALGKEAYKTIIDFWSPIKAAKSFISLSECILSGNNPNALFKIGPCSPSPNLKNGWYKSNDKI